MIMSEVCMTSFDCQVFFTQLLQLNVHSFLYPYYLTQWMYFSIAGLTGEARDEALRDLGIGINKR